MLSSRVSFLVPLILAAAARGQTTAPAGDILYADPAANSAATVAQILPNSTITTQTFTAVERIVLRQDVFVVYWGQGAVTMLPRQFVQSLTVNRRAAAPASPATQPAHQP